MLEGMNVGLGFLRRSDFERAYREAEAEALKARAEAAQQDRERVLDNVLDALDWVNGNRNEQEKPMSTTQKIDLSKTYRTRGGNEVKLYAIDESLGKYPVVGVRLLGENHWVSERWTLKGEFYGVKKSPEDLVEVKRKQVAYLNVYPGGVDQRLFKSQFEANIVASRESRIACIRVEFEEGQFDD